MAFSQAIEVKSDGAVCSIGMLFGMLLTVFVAIIAFKWKMTKRMGGMMIVLYALFVVMSLGFTFKWWDCPL